MPSRNDETLKKVIEEQSKMVKIVAKRSKEKDSEIRKWQAEYIKIFRDYTRAKKKIKQLKSKIKKLENELENNNID